MKLEQLAEPIAIEIDPLPWQAMLSTICHDLKDPLASIVMGTGYLQRALPADDASGPARRVVDAIGRSTDRMTRLLTDFSDLAALDRHELTLRWASHGISEIARAAMDQIASQASPHGISATLDVAPAIEELAVRCDAARLTQILVQLAAAALRVAPEKGSLALKVEADGDASVRFHLQTSGPASPRDATLPRMETPKLPLALARGLIELHGGCIEASRDDDGVAFTFTIPRASTPR